MRELHRPDLLSWAVFDAARDLDFNGYAWIRPGGSVLIDPVPMCDHDLAQLRERGGAATVVITNSDHVRAAVELAAALGAEVAGPAAEREALAEVCDRWLRDGDEVVPGLGVLELEGSKTPGELALLLEGSTLVTGDLVRGQRGGRLNALPAGKLSDPEAAARSLRRLAALEGVDAVLVGDGWPVFREGRARLRELCEAP